MSFLNKVSFSGGELDPALRKRINLDKFQAGLSTARSVWIGKSGRIISRAGMLNYKTPNNQITKVIIFGSPSGQYLIEWGHLYLTNYDLNTSTEQGITLAHTFTEDDIENLHFTFGGNYLYIFLKGSAPLKLLLTTTTFVTPAAVFSTPSSPNSIAPVSNGTGYAVNYAATMVVGGEESDAIYSPTGLPFPYLLPINNGEHNAVTVNSAGAGGTVTEIRIYRRPENGNAYGYIGSIGDISNISTNVSGFQDIGQEADYTRSPPKLNIDPDVAYPKTGLIYQQKLLIANVADNQEAIHTSRTGLTNNFQRDYPLNDISSLSFKAGTSGNANVLRMADIGPLVAFTTAGVYANEFGPLSVSNLAMIKQGGWVIDEKVPPLQTPSGLMFVDRANNIVRILKYSTESNRYDSDEISIFSNHLFQNKRVKSWAFQDGDIPLIWVVFTDGSCVTLTYQPEQQMKAWTRQDTDGLFECVTSLVNDEGTTNIYFVMNRNGVRTIEKLAPRYSDDYRELVTVDSGVLVNTSWNSVAATAASNTFTANVITDLLNIPNHRISTGKQVMFTTTGTLPGGLSLNRTHYVIRVDANNIKVALTAADAAGNNFINITSAGTGTHTIKVADGIEAIFTLTPDVDNDWSGNIKITSDVWAFADAQGQGNIGSIFRMFDENGSSIDFESVEFIDGQNVMFTPSREVPVELRTTPTLYITYDYIGGLGHLIGRTVSVFVDGGVVSSPNDDIENLTDLTVVDESTFDPDTGALLFLEGKVYLPGTMRGAIMSAGLPFTSDVGTLNVDSLDGKSVILEQKLVNHVVVSVLNSRGIYIGAKFPDDDKVKGMSIDEPNTESDPFNSALKPQTKDIDVLIEGEYSFGGQIAIRNVAPIGFEIIAIVPDLEIPEG